MRLADELEQVDPVSAVGGLAVEAQVLEERSLGLGGEVEVPTALGLRGRCLLPASRSSSLAATKPSKRWSGQRSSACRETVSLATLNIGR